MRTTSGQYDRRITVEVATATEDSAGDPILTWSVAFQRWARKRDLTEREKYSAAQVIRESDIEWTLRADSQSRLIYPESHRFWWKDRLFEIVGVVDTPERDDAIRFICCTRPDGRGARGPQPAGTG